MGWSVTGPDGLIAVAEKHTRAASVREITAAARSEGRGTEFKKAVPAGTALSFICGARLFVQQRRDVRVIDMGPVKPVEAGVDALWSPSRIACWSGSVWTLRKTSISQQTANTP
jgi:hypothetical protein